MPTTRHLLRTWTTDAGAIEVAFTPLGSRVRVSTSAPYGAPRHEMYPVEAARRHYASLRRAGYAPVPVTAPTVCVGA